MDDTSPASHQQLGHRLHPREGEGRLLRWSLRRPGPDPLSARAQRVPPHRSCQVDLPQLRDRRRVRRHVPPAFRRHEPRDRGRRLRRGDRRRRSLAGFRAGVDPLHVGLLRPARRLGRAADRGRVGVRRRPGRRRDLREPRRLPPARGRQPVARPVGRGEPRPLRPHAGGRVRRRRAGPAGEDRHGPREHADARSDPLPDPPGPPLPHRRRVVRVPDLRLGPRPERRRRGHDPLAVHARVRHPPAALRVVPRPARSPGPTGPARPSSPGSSSPTR